VLVETPRPRWAGASGLPCVGRDDLLEELRALLDAASVGHRSSVVLDGEAGLGKTTVASVVAFCEFYVGQPAAKSIPN